MTEKLQTQIGKKVFNTPFFVGSSDLVGNCKEAENVIKFANGLVGSIIWKSTTLEAKEGYQEPRICDFYGGFLVASGMRNIGLPNTIREIKHFKKKYPNQSVILSIASVDFEDPVKEFVSITKQILDLEIDGIELNLSCPHQVQNEKHQTKVIAQNADLVGAIVKEVKAVLNSTDKLLIAKLTGWNADISHISAIAEKNGADAITVSNIFPGIGYYTGLKKYQNGFKYEVGEPLLGNFKGGYTGIAMLPATLLIVNTVKNTVNIPVIATGGCMSSNDAMIQTFLAGASAIASATFYYDENCCKCRNFSKDLQERSKILQDFYKEKLQNP